MFHTPSYLCVTPSAGLPQATSPVFLNKQCTYVLIFTHCPVRLRWPRVDNGKIHAEAARVKEDIATASF
jgi:hypothetical protein